MGDVEELLSDMEGHLFNLGRRMGDVEDAMAAPWQHLLGPGEVIVGRDRSRSPRGSQGREDAPMVDTAEAAVAPIPDAGVSGSVAEAARGLQLEVFEDQGLV